MLLTKENVRVVMGRWIREHRERAGWSQQVLGDMLALSQPMVVKLEAGQGPVAMERLLELCVVFSRRPARAFDELEAIASSARGSA